MLTWERPLGRLIELRIASPVTDDDVEMLVGARRATETMGEQIACSDCRGIEVMSPETTARLVAAFRDHSSGLLRNGVLVAGGKAVVALQLERVLREARHPGRRLFRQPEALLAWLDERCDEAERARLRQFLGVAQGA